jgi:hypothetical protein
MKCADLYSFSTEGSQSMPHFTSRSVGKRDGQCSFWVTLSDGHGMSNAMGDCPSFSGARSREHSNGA